MNLRAYLQRFCRGFCLALFLGLLITDSDAQNASEPLQVAKSIADKVIRETAFEFTQAPQQPVLGIQVLDFGSLYPQQSLGAAYARSLIHSQQDTTIRFGLSSSSAVKLWLNGKLVLHRKDKDAAAIREIAYNMVEFEDTFELSLNRGPNSVLIKSAATSANWVCLLRALTPRREQERSVHFTLDIESDEPVMSNWLFVGPFASDEDAIDTVFPPELEIRPLYTFDGKHFVWRTLPQNMLAELVIPAENSYQRESYIEWHYANGALMLAMLALSDATDESGYADFAKRYCDFALQHYDYFKWQYEELHAYRGSYHRLFRRTMLDDAGAPALPFVELQLRNAGQYDAIISPLSEYVSHEQVRLQNGVFCRPEPVEWTVWADDLFMSAPFLLRVARLRNNTQIYDDVANQVVNFNQLLYDSETGLYKHGWFEPEQQTSVAFWGRANGWVAWASSEALLYLPQSHPQYGRILELFQDHMAGLSRYQDESGMWHQVLDHPQSYEETSCTAMFVLAMARGVRQGWLDNKYKSHARRGWQALEQKIDADGTVHGICRGTGIGNSLAFYFERETFDHDPRGLGATIFAALEAAKLISNSE